MIKSTDSTKNDNTDELMQKKWGLNKKLLTLEKNLKKFRSTSPEKWIEEVDENTIKQFMSNQGDTSSSFLDLSVSEEVIKTIAENEDFIKQRIGDIKEVLGEFSSKIIPEELITLRDDVKLLQESTSGLLEMINSKDYFNHDIHTSLNVPFDALKTSLKQIIQDITLLLDDSYLVQSKGNIQTRLITSVRYLGDIQTSNGLINKDIPLVDIKVALSIVEETLEDLQKIIFSAINNNNTRVKKENQKQIKISQSVEERSTNSFGMFDHLNQCDFTDMESLIGSEIIEYILKCEEEEIKFLRDEFSESLTST